MVMKKIILTIAINLSYIHCKRFLSLECYYNKTTLTYTLDEKDKLHLKNLKARLSSGLNATLLSYDDKLLSDIIIFYNQFDDKYISFSLVKALICIRLKSQSKEFVDELKQDPEYEAINKMINTLLALISFASSADNEVDAIWDIIKSLDANNKAFYKVCLACIIDEKILGKLLHSTYSMLNIKRNYQYLFRHLSAIFNLMLAENGKLIVDYRKKSGARIKVSITISNDGMLNIEETDLDCSAFMTYITRLDMGHWDIVIPNLYQNNKKFKHDDQNILLYIIFNLNGYSSSDDHLPCRLDGVFDIDSSSNAELRKMHRRMLGIKNSEHSEPLNISIKKKCNKKIIQ